MKYQFLNRINKPSAIKKLDAKQMQQLASEVRDFMVKSVAKTGGHLASSLGAVEVTLALFKVFNPPSDKIIWDVGHQAYSHKILTGRRKAFTKLRQKKGISGFLKPGESPYDVFGAGHTSTSISSAMGFAKVRDIKKQKHEVVAVIGDASLANGMSLEAINNIGHDKTNMLIVVIDNEMSISPTVGALSKYMSQIMTGGVYNRFRSATKNIIEKIPGIGLPTANIMKHAEEALKGIVSPGIIFEELGLRFFGPINGHDIKLLVSTLENIKKIEGPKILHVFTKKGRGYGPAEKKPTLFHGIGPFDPATGEPFKPQGAPAYSKVFSEALVHAARSNKKIVAIVAAMIEGTNLSLFRDLYPERFFDVGIAEEHAVTFAAGLAAAGMKPVVAVYSTFMQRSVDQIIHDAGIQKLPVMFVMDRAGIVGEDGPTHHGVFDIAFMKMVPGMVVMAPADETDLRAMVKLGTKLAKGPCSIRFPRGESFALPAGIKKTRLMLGKGRLIKKGTSVTVVTLGPVLAHALRAAEESEKTAGKIEIIDARFAKPLDLKLIARSVRKTGRLVTMEEGCIEGGFGQSLVQALNEAGVKFRAKTLGIPDKFAGQGTMQEVRDECGISVTNLLAAVNTLLKG